jgi:cell division septation protein DedD
MQTTAAEDIEKLRAFEQRMQQEGAAAFAAGPAPWEHWDDTGTLGTYHVWMDTVHHKPAPEKPPRKPLANRLVTGLAQLALLALLVGTGGVYYSTLAPEQVRVSGIQPPPIVLAGRPALRPATAALPVIRTQTTDTDTLARAQPDTEEALAATVIPLQLEQNPTTPGDTPAVAADQGLAMTLDTLPGTAAGPSAESAAAPASTAAPATESAGLPATTPAPAADVLPQHIALREEAIESMPETPAREAAPAQKARDLQNTWVVNLASYNFESMAKRKLAAFRAKGVNAELEHVTVKGKPMIRIRTTGYQSRREASDWVTLLEERLGLEGAWIAKYQPSEQ